MRTGRGSFASKTRFLVFRWWWPPPRPRRSSAATPGPAHLPCPLHNPSVDAVPSWSHDGPHPFRICPSPRPMTSARCVRDIWRLPMSGGVGFRRVVVRNPVPSPNAFRHILSTVVAPFGGPSGPLRRCLPPAAESCAEEASYKFRPRSCRGVTGYLPTWCRWCVSAETCVFVRDFELFSLT